MINLFQSNRIEALAIALSHLMQAEPLSPFDEEVILVESAAMSGWLMQQLAGQQGVAAHCRFPFPAAFVWQLYRQQQPDLPLASAFDRLPLTFRLYAYLSRKRKDQSVFKKVSLYLEHLSTNCQLIDFCHYLAGLYDQYQIYRPELLIGWQKQRNENNFQAAIWFDLHQESKDKDRAEIFLEIMQSEWKHLDKLHVKRVQVFALSQLPGPYLQLLEKLSEFIDVNLFVLNPCALFWSDINKKNSKEQEANPLLSMMAVQARDFQRQLEDIENIQVSDSFIDAEPTTLLMQLQSDILHLKHRKPDDEKIKIAPNDNSLMFHAAHSPRREVEIVKNQLLHFLNDHPHLDFDDVAIMVSDLERYGPFIQSVFEGQDNPVPFHIAEKKSLADSSCKAVLLDLLHLPAADFAKQAVIDCLKLTPVTQRFGFESLPFIVSLLDELGVQFGLHDDAWLALGEHVASFALHQAKARLLDSYCMLPDEQGTSLFGIAGEAAQDAGRLCMFIDALTLLDIADKANTPKVWVAFIEKLLAAFFDQDNEEVVAECRAIRELLDKWLSSIELSEFDDELDFNVFSHLLSQLFESLPMQHYFKKGVVNVATLLPMRSLPFQMIGLLGMNDGEFPGTSVKDPLDALQQEPKPGDRNRQSEERYLFLEALLSARQKVHISYIGRSAIDNTERFPSLLVSELLAFIDDHVEVAGRPARERLLIQHPLQAFDEAYFKPVIEHNETLQSLSAKQLSEAKALMTPSQTLSFMAHVDEKELSAEMALSTFVNALIYPQKYYCQQLGVLPKAVEIDETSSELMTPRGLEDFVLLDQLNQNKQLEVEALTAQGARIQGLIPQGQLGNQHFQEKQAQADHLFGEVLDLGLDKTNTTYLVELMVEQGLIKGELDGFTSDLTKRLCFVGNKLKGKRVLQAWLEHVLFTAEGSTPLTSYLISSGSTLTFKPVSCEFAETLVSSWLVRVQKAATELLPFFVESGFAYVEAYAKNPDKAEGAFRNKLEGGFNQIGELADILNDYAFRGNDVFIADALAERNVLFEPLTEYMEVAKR